LALTHCHWKLSPDALTHGGLQQHQLLRLSMLQRVLVAVVDVQQCWQTLLLHVLLLVCIYGSPAVVQPDAVRTKRMSK
jgi:hypothetical protein